MTNIKLAVSVSAGEAQSSMDVELVPVDGGKCQPIINVTLSNGFRNSTTLPPRDYKKLGQTLEKMAKTSDIAAIESLAKKLMTILNF